MLINNMMPAFHIRSIEVVYIVELDCLSPFPGGFLKLPAEAAGKAVAAVEASLVSDLADGQVGLGQQLFSDVEPEVQPVLMDRYFEELFETYPQFEGIDAYFKGKRSDGQLAGWIFGKDLLGFVDVGEVVAFDGLCLHGVLIDGVVNDEFSRWAGTECYNASGTY
jgi:hypothetical protein